MATAVLQDRFEAPLWPLLRLKPAFLLRDGILTPLERLRRSGINTTEVQSNHSLSELSLFCKIFDIAPLKAAAPDGAALDPASLVAGIGEKISTDLALLNWTNYSNPERAVVEGDRAALFAHPTAHLSRHAVFDTTAGPVVVDQEAQIGAFCLLKGPLYIGPKTQLDNCQISNAIVGTSCRIGGEVSDSIIGDYSNKHHEGFLGHSLVGDWVNLGALTTTSDLKNNYGEIKLPFKATNYATQTIKFGSIIGDFVKTAIGTLLNTGTVIDIGANLFGESRWSGYVEPFTWGSDARYDLTLFLRDAQRMMQRRGKHVSAGLEELLKNLYS